MSIAVEIADRHRNTVRVEVPLEATVGALRNTVNGALPRGFVLGEHDVVPGPFAHYVEDDPECFRGPADGWRLADVFFDDLAAAPLAAVRCASTASTTDWMPASLSLKTPSFQYLVRRCMKPRGSVRSRRSACTAA